MVSIVKKAGSFNFECKDIEDDRKIEEYDYDRDSQYRCDIYVNNDKMPKLVKYMLENSSVEFNCSFFKQEELLIEPEINIHDTKLLRIPVYEVLHPFYLYTSNHSATLMVSGLKNCVAIFVVKKDNDGKFVGVIGAHIISHMFTIPKTHRNFYLNIMEKQKLIEIKRLMNVYGMNLNNSEIRVYGRFNNINYKEEHSVVLSKIKKELKNPIFTYVLNQDEGSVSNRFGVGSGKVIWSWAQDDDNDLIISNDLSLAKGKYDDYDENNKNNEYKDGDNDEDEEEEKYEDEFLTLDSHRDWGEEGEGNESEGD